MAENPVETNAKAIAQLKASLDGLEDTQKRLTGTTKGWSNTQGLAEKSTRKLHQWFLGSRIGRMHTMAKMFGSLSKVVNKFTDDEEELARETDQLTVIQKKLLLPMMRMLPATKAGQRMMEKYRETLDGTVGIVELLKAGFYRVMSVLFSLVGILAIIGFAWAAFSIAVNGADSSIVGLTESFWPLHEAMLGVAAIMTGEGGGWNMLLGALLLITAAFIALPTAIAPFVIAIIFAVGIFKRLENAGFSAKESLLGAAGTFLAVLYTMLRPVKALRFFMKILGYLLKVLGKGLSFLKTKLPTIARFAVNTVKWLVSSGIGLIVAGLLMLWAYASGRIGGWLGTLVGLVGAALLAIGLFLATSLTLVPALIIGALAFVVAWVYRNWDEIKATLAAGAVWLGEQLAALGAAAGTFITQTVPEWLGGVKDDIIEWVRNTDWGGIFMGIAEALGDGIVWAIKTILNAMIGLMNIVGEHMPTIQIPDWDILPNSIQGKSLDLGFKIPELAEGGIVTAPTLALIGEAGPEAVVPLDGKHGMSNTINVNIDVSGVTDRSDKRALAREISDIINQELRRTGGQPTRGRY